MSRIFVHTPVKAEPSSSQDALVLYDARGHEVMRIETPTPPGGKPGLDAVALATIQDVSRQFNELHAVLEEAASERSTQAGKRMVLGIETERMGNALGDWAFAVQIMDGEGTELERVTVRVSAVSYEWDPQGAREAIDRALDAARTLSRAGASRT